MRPAVGASRAATLPVRVQTRASGNEIVGERNGRLVIRLTAPPVDGRANRALRELIAKRLGVAKGRVEIVRGAGSRDKLVQIEGFDSRGLRSKLNAG